MAEKHHASMSEEDRTKLVETIIRGLPGRTTEQYTLQTFREAIALYDGVDDAAARRNLREGPYINDVRRGSGILTPSFMGIILL